MTWAPVAQLDRASASGVEGHEFESRRVYHFFCLCCRKLQNGANRIKSPSKVRQKSGRNFRCGKVARTAWWFFGHGRRYRNAISVDFFGDLSCNSPSGSSKTSGKTPPGEHDLSRRSTGLFLHFRIEAPIGNRQHGLNVFIGKPDFPIFGDDQFEILFPQLRHIVDTSRKPPAINEANLLIRAVIRFPQRLPVHGQGRLIQIPGGGTILAQ